MSHNEELELVEEYVLNGVRRYQFKHNRTGVQINVSAGSREEALRKALSILAKFVEPLENNPQ